MERRRFLKTLTGFPLFGLARLARANPEPRGIVLQESPLAGYPFHRDRVKVRVFLEREGEPR